MAKSKQWALHENTKLKLVAIHKQSFVTFEKEITYKEWVLFKKHPDYYYNTYQIR